MADKRMAIEDASPVQWSTGIVKAVLSGDTIVIMDSNNCATTAELPCERSITLSEIMAPRLARRSGHDDEPFAWQSRVFLRNCCLGKEVQYFIERTIQGTKKNLGTVYVGNRNLSAVMVVNSLAWVKKAALQEGGNLKKQKASKTTQKDHKELQLTNLGELISIQNKVKDTGYGVWSKKREEQEKAMRRLLPSRLDGYDDFDCKSLLQAIKGKKIKAFVEYVRDGSGLRVYLLPYFYFVQMFVQGVKLPSMGRKEVNEKDGIASEPLAREAKHFVEVRLLNRDGLVTIYGCDAFGNFSGTVIYKDGDEEKNLSIELLENGFARYLDSSGRRMDQESQDQLRQVELTTKNKRVGIWKDYVEPVQSSDKRDEEKNITRVFANKGSEKNNTRVFANESRRYKGKGNTEVFANPINFKAKQTLKVGITEVLGGGKLYFRTLMEQDNVVRVQQQLQNLILQKVSHVRGFQPKKGDIVLAQYSVYGSWNRAKIVDDSDKFDVLYIDYGTQEKVSLTAVRPFDENAYSGPELAYVCSLAYITVPEEFGEAAKQYLSQYTTRDVMLTIEEIVKVQKQSTLLVTLVDFESGININAALLEEGLASLRTDNADRKKERYAAFESLRKHELEAKKNMKNIWKNENS